MPNSTSAFFHQQRLAVAFMQGAARALREQQIDQAEHAWLETLLTTATGSASVDLLETNDGSDPPELTGTLMFSESGSTSHRVFVQNPIYGLEVFEDRAAVDRALRHRITAHGTTLEATQVPGDVFTAQMNSYLSKRAIRLGRMAEELARLPTLNEQIGASTTTTASATAYHRALQQFWKTSTAGSKHLHQLASKAFAEGFYQDLAQARLADNSNPLLQLDPDAAPLQASALYGEKILVRLGSEWVELAGAFTLSLKSQNALLLYWPPTGLQLLSGEGALHAYLNALTAPVNLPLKYAQQWHASTARLYQKKPVKQSLFVDRIDSIVTLQELNLAYALSVAGDDIAAAQIAVDDAIDVRTLIDRRLGTLDPALRWARARTTPDLEVLSLDPVVQPLLQSIDRLAWLASERDHLYGLSPGIRALAQRLLQPALAVFDGGLQAQKTRLHRATPQEPATGDLSLVDVLLQRISGFCSEPLSNNDTFSDLDGQDLSSLAPAAVEQTLHHAAQVFGSRFARQLKNSNTLSLCLDERWVSLPTLLRKNLKDGIRLEMVLHGYFKTLPHLQLQQLQQVFDTPLASQRQALGMKAVRVSGLQLNLSPDLPGIRLKLAFVIDLPASADQPLLFWSPVEGLKAYASLEQLERTLIHGLTTGPRQTAWQDLLPVMQVGEWQPWLERSVRADLSLSTWTIDGDLLDELQTTLFKEQNDNARTALAFAIADQDRPGIFEPFIDRLHTDDAIAGYFEDQSLRFADLHTREVLPDWLRLATPTQFSAFSILLSSTTEMLSPQNSYLSGIPTIIEFARQQLRAPGQGLCLGQHRPRYIDHQPEILYCSARTYRRSPLGHTGCDS